MFDSDNRGQVGIGTLIVFIAMVLVAAIAAGVLINTAGFLQAQAEATGEESAEQVSDRVQVVSVTGDADGDVLDELNVSVRRAAGADDIDLNNSIVEVFANGDSSTLVHDEDGPDEAENQFGVEMVEGDDNVLADSSDRADLHIELTDDQQLEEGDTVTLTITTAAGGTAFVEKRAPSTIEDGDSYRL